ncbi:MAG: hypothetical protein LJE65_07225 [Desulfobacteraceae bacterium]|nr:hypothetical protein [Desulfobacteraceae bacterium]
MDPGVAEKETVRIVAHFLTAEELHSFEQAVLDVHRLFHGSYPGFRASNTSYHDWVHTLYVVLATARLIHGCMLNGHLFLSRHALLAMLAALFHDTGLIQEESDAKGTGAKHTVGHEERSISVLDSYLSQRGYSAPEIDIGDLFIRCTILNVSPRTLSFSSESLRQLGYIVGSADLLAQMADRLYLEKLLLLYEEFEEAGLPAYESALDLLQKTSHFYENVAKKRLREEFEGIGGNMRPHFRQWHDLDRDCYSEAIEKNILYLKKVHAMCRESFTCFLKHLKRGGISQKILSTASREQ